MLAGHIPWHKTAKDLVEGGGFGGVDPSFLFDWPFARVLAVFFLGAAGGCRTVSQEEALEAINRRRAAKGLPPQVLKGK